MGIDFDAAKKTVPTGGATRKAPSRGGRGVSSLKGFGAGLLQGGTAGYAGNIGDDISAISQGNYTSGARDTMNMLFGPVGPAISNLMGLEEEVPGPVTKALEGAIDEAPISGFIGELGGGIAMGGGMSGLGRNLGKETLKSGPAWSKKLTDFLVNTTRGRVATGAAVGGGEGYTRAKNVGDDPMEGLMWGTVGGGAGQAVLGELFPWGARYFSGSDKPQAAANYLVDDARIAQGRGPGSGRKLDTNKIEGRIDELGPEATLADANVGFRRSAKGLVGSSDAKPMVQDTLYRFDPEGERGEEIVNQFQDQVLEVLPDVFTKTNKADPRSPSVVREAAKAERQRLQPEWDRVLDEGHDPLATVREIETEIGNYVDFNLTTHMTQQAKNQLKSTLKRLNKQSITQAKQKGVDPASLPVGYLSPRALLTLRKELDQVANKALKGQEGTDRELAAHVLEARRGINDWMVENIPEFGRINAQYSNEFSYERGYKAARDAILSNKMHSDDLKLAMKHANPADMPAFVEGGAEALVEILERDTKGLTSARNFIKNKNTIRKFEQLYGKDGAKAILDAADQAITFKKTQTSIGGGSPTQPRTKEAEALETFVRRSILGAGLARIAGYKGKNMPSIAITSGVAQKEARHLSREARGNVYPIMDKWLAATGDDAKAALKDMTKLAEHNWPSSSIRGMHFDPDRPVSVFNDPKSLMDLNVGQTPAFATGSATAGTMAEEEKKPKRRSRKSNDRN